MTDETTPAERLAEKIRIWCARNGKAVTWFGRNALRDPNFYGDLLDGREPSSRTIEKCNRFMMAME